MDFNDVCLHCFQPRGGYEVCPYCGHVACTPNQPAYLLQPGARLWGRYIIGTVLGVGGFGATYRAWDTRLAALVAIKEFFPQNLVSRIPGESKLRAFSGEKLEAYAAQLARFMDEAKNLAKFNGDAHIVNVFDFFEDNNSAYIVMEYLDGATLKEHLAARGGALPPEEAASIMEGLLSALASIHQKGILHRDVSPDNIFILRDGRVKLLDFGAARFALKDEWTQSVVVKKGYAPPEQYRSNMKQTERTDLYAAGATWYKMLTGVTPEESIERWEKDLLQRPSKLGAAVDPNTDKAVMKAMALRPELRFKSAESMLAAVKGQTGFDFPEVELKKRRRVRGASIALAAVSVITALAVAGWQISNAPTTVTLGPTLADMNIKPDSITLLVSDYDDEDGAYTELATAFMEKYPDYRVEVVTTTYEEIEANPPDFSQPGSPTVLRPYWGDDRDYRGDLTPLITGLDRSEYYLMDQYEEWHEEMDVLPLSFSCYMAVGSPGKAAEAGVTLPESFTSFEQILDAYEPLPQSMDMPYHMMETLMGWYKPGLYDGSYHPELWEADLRRYVDYRAASRENNWYGDGYLDVDQGNIWNLRNAQERWLGDYRVIPIENKGNSMGYFSDSFTVNRYSTENQQLVGMLFLHFLLSEYGQNVLYVQQQDSLPLNRKAMAQVMELYPQLAVMEKTFDNLQLDRYGSAPGLYEVMNPLLGYDAEEINPDAVMQAFMQHDPEAYIQREG